MSTPVAVDLTNCDREPIHIPGSIQPHGVMLVCDPLHKTVEYASANAAMLLGPDVDQIIGRRLEEVLGAEIAHRFANASAASGGSEVAGIVLGVVLPATGQVVDAAIHHHAGRMFIELEPSVSAEHDALDITQTLVRRIGRETTVASLAATGAKLVRAMLGYDRVMVYQFLHNGAGRVIAEAKIPRLKSFLGQHFPASDIPAQARRLYLVNSIRMIGDAAYRPVALTPGLPPGEAPVDMSFAQLRSVSPIHCEYLRNMGVAASLSISIIVEGELWGLISCHHDTPKVVSLPLRIGAELFGQHYSLQIAAAEHRAERAAAAAARANLDRVLLSVDPDAPVVEALARSLGDLASLVPTQGAGIWMDGRWRSMGDAPSADAAEALVGHAIATAPGAIWHTQDLKGEGLAAGDRAALVTGALAIPISSVPRDYLVLFRDEEAHNIEWAGKPEKVMVSSPLGDRLTPRGSFEVWREEVRGRSEPWTPAELTVAETIRSYLRDVVLRVSEVTADERTRAEQRRRVLNDELNHRVKNIISLVKSIALQTGAHAADVSAYSASLEGRLNALAFAHDQSLSAGGGVGDLETLVEAEAALHRYGADDRVVTSGPRVGLDDRAFGVVALVIHEMMTNAAKYGALSVPGGRLEVAWTTEPDGDCVLTWRERDGPPVSPPRRMGFGSKLITSTIEYDLGGSAQVDYAADGVVARFVIPGAHVQENLLPAAARPHHPSGTTPLRGLNVLLVEDQALIAMDTEVMLRLLGAAQVDASPTARDALARLDADTPDIAVLDFNLGVGTSEAVAEVLWDRGIPFVFATGYGDADVIPDRFRKAPVVRKPVGADILADRLLTAMALKSSATGS